MKFSQTFLNFLLIIYENIFMTLFKTYSTAQFQDTLSDVFLKPSAKQREQNKMKTTQNLQYTPTFLNTNESKPFLSKT